MSRVPRIPVAESDRVLVLGASGWLGKTFLSQLPESAVVLSVGGVMTPLNRWSEDSVADFDPTVVANFAFLTPSRMQGMGRHSFIQTNRHLSERFAFAAGLPSVRAGLTISSGMAVPGNRIGRDPSIGLYGQLKAGEEELALGMACSARSVVVARAYSLSGALVRRPADYAFSEFILQAPSGSISIASRMEVWRRYSAAADFLYVASILALSGWSGIVESGGPLIELGALADLVIQMVNPNAVIKRSLDSSIPPQIYASNGSSWATACKQVGYEPQNLEDQVASVAAAMLGSA